MSNERTKINNALPFLVFGLMVIGAMTPVTASAQTGAAQGPQESVEARQLTIPNLVQALNNDRIENGLAPLRRNAALDRAAALKAADMVAGQYFSHTSPTGVSPWHWFKASDYAYAYAGENLALDFNNSEKVQAAWMESPLHRANALNSDYEDVGYAVAEGTFTSINGAKKMRQGIIIVQLFGKSLPEAPALATRLDPLLSPAATAPSSRRADMGAKIAAAASNSSQSLLQIDYSNIGFAGDLKKSAIGLPPIEWPEISFPRPNLSSLTFMGTPLSIVLAQ